MEVTAIGSEPAFEQVAPPQFALPGAHGFADTLRAAVTPQRGQTHAGMVHEVARGDTLWSICRAQLARLHGRAPTNAEISGAVRAVAAHNRLANPDLILPGQRLDLSPLGAEIAKAAPDPGRALASLRPAPAPSTPLGGPTGAQAVARAAYAEHRGAAPGAELTPRMLAQLVRGTGQVTSQFGPRADPFTGDERHHDGIDIAASPGTKVAALGAGQVVFSGWDEGYGNLVIVRHRNGQETLYAHNSALLVSEGDRVQRGAAIAEVGSTGRSTGPHLHFEVRRNGQAVNPLPYLRNAYLL